MDTRLELRRKTALAALDDLLKELPEEISDFKIRLHYSTSESNFKQDFTTIMISRRIEITKRGCGGYPDSLYYPSEGEVTIGKRGSDGIMHIESQTVEE